MWMPVRISVLVQDMAHRCGSPMLYRIFHQHAWTNYPIANHDAHQYGSPYGNQIAHATMPLVVA
jgi:hypothetical protein